MASKSTFFSFVFFLIISFAAANDLFKEHKFYRAKVNNYPTIVVDPLGKGNFTTIQAAIDHVPANNENWIRLYIKAGNYREQLHIPMEKPFIYIQGEGKWRTRVNWDGSENIQTNATFMSEADNIFVKSMSFINTYNYPAWSGKNTMKAAAAASIYGDKCAFHRVGFVGFQDTLWDVQGRHYFTQCTIQGAVDFIFGAGQSIYQSCIISVVAGSLDKGVAGFITAQGRSDPSETNGFIFKECNVIGNGLTYLGRPWRPYARVVFLNSDFWDIIVPEGWASWTTQGHENQLTFAEYGCKGKGSNTAYRVPWEYKLSVEMVNQLSSISFIDDEGWIGKLPLKLTI